MSNNEYKQKKYSEIKPGEVFAFGGQNWIRLEEAGLCVMEDILEERAFGEESNDWRKSKLREYLNEDFYWDLRKDGANEKDFLMIETDLTADDGMKDYGTSKDLISLMTADLYRSNRHLLKPLEDWWWLATPHTCLPSGSHHVRCVNSSGSLSYNYACNGNGGVRPLINLSPDAPVFVVKEKVKKYRKKPVVVEAIKYYKTSIGSAQNFCDKMKYNPHNNEYYIETLEGTMLITEGDYIIKGVNGEFYPCKADIFEKTYEEDLCQSM